MGHLQHLHKQACQFVNEAATKSGQGVVVGVVASGNVAKGDRVIGGCFQLATGEHPGAVAVDQNGQQSGWVVRLGAASGVLTGQACQIQAIDDFHHEARKVVLAEPLVYRWGGRR